MKYTLIKGTFHVVGYSPDGDSLMFKARNQARWDKIVTDQSCFSRSSHFVVPHLNH